MVSANLINEGNVDLAIPLGMEQSQVEKTIGKAFDYRKSDQSVVASYFIDGASAESGKLYGFCVVYRHNKVVGIHKTWLD
jgi:hypothetical protein